MSVYLNQALFSPGREFTTEVLFGETVVSADNVIGFSVEEEQGNGGIPFFGSAPATQLELEVLTEGLPASFLALPVTVKIGLIYDFHDPHWYTFGPFYLTQDSIEKGKITTKMTGYSPVISLDIPYESNLIFPSTSFDVVTDIGNRNGFSVGTMQGHADIPIPVKPEGTVRNVLAQLSQLLGRPVEVTDATIAFPDFYTDEPLFTFTPDDYVDFTRLSDATARITQLVVPQDEGEPLIAGDATGYAMEFDSPLFTQERLSQLATEHLPYEYIPFELTLRGFPSITNGSIIDVVALSGQTHRLLVAGFRHDFSGGVTTKVWAGAPPSTNDSGRQNVKGVIKESIRRVHEDMENAIASATALITGNSGGHVVTRTNHKGEPIELLVMDTPDIATAQNVWRWNQLGLGHSTSGYNGPYGTAITADGQIVADFMTTGTLNAELVKTGILSSKDGNTVINLETGTFNLGGKVLYDGNRFELNLAGSTLGNTLGNMDKDLQETKQTLGEVTTRYTDRFNDLDKAQKDLQVGFSMNRQGVEFRFGSVEKALEEDGDRLTSLESRIVLNDDGIGLYSSKNQKSLHLSNEKMHMDDSGQEMWSIDGQTIDIWEANVRNSMIIGQQKLMKQDGKTTFQWVGDF